MTPSVCHFRESFEAVCKVELSYIDTLIDGVTSSSAIADMLPDARGHHAAVGITYS